MYWEYRKLLGIELETFEPPTDEILCWWWKGKKRPRRTAVLLWALEITIMNSYFQFGITNTKLCIRNRNFASHIVNKVFEYGECSLWCCMPEICWVATCIVKLLNLVEMDDCLSLNTLLLSLPFHFFFVFFARLSCLLANKKWLYCVVTEARAARNIKQLH